MAFQTDKVGPEAGEDSFQVCRNPVVVVERRKFLVGLGY